MVDGHPLCEIRCGVPQGSILGPLLFLIYVNDVCNMSKVLDFILLADDTNIFFLIETLIIRQWGRAYKLSINFKKSNFMVFERRQKRRKLDIFMKISDKSIERVKETGFLAVVIDENLSWKPHTLNISRKISKSIGIIYKSTF